MYAYAYVCICTCDLFSATLDMQHVFRSVAACVMCLGKAQHRFILDAAGSLRPYTLPALTPSTFK